MNKLHPPHVKPPPKCSTPRSNDTVDTGSFVGLDPRCIHRVAAQAMAQFAVQHPSIRPLLHLAEVENYPQLSRRRSRGRKR
ncbi:UNVERIFIED_CONTAM: hypothetical protein Slati_2918700 [Sesamum latifolium]|uniref:Uncharacterized protein n=1 Tax=Sesamum latifolium TaxID=2727402 RepID=A0AAW2VEP0_9LAMI